MNKTIVEYLTAVLEGDYEKIDRFLEGGLDVGVCCVNGNTAMRNASQSSDIEMLKYLVSKGADVNHRSNFLSPVDGRSEEGFTPIFYAGDADTLNYLIASGADINATCKAGYTALMKCCKYSFERIVPLIEAHIRAGADISMNAPGQKGSAPASALDIALNTKHFQEELYDKHPNEKLKKCMGHSEYIVNLLSGNASNKLSQQDAASGASA